MVKNDTTGPHQATRPTRILHTNHYTTTTELKHLPPTTTTVAAGYKRPRSDSLSSAVSTLGDDDDPTTAIHQPIIPQPPPPAPMTRAHSVHSFAPSGGGLCTLGAATPLAPPAVIPPENSTTTASNSSNNKAGAGGVGLQLQWGPVLCAPSSAAAGTAPPVPVVAASADDTPLSKRARAGGWVRLIGWMDDRSTTVSSRPGSLSPTTPHEHPKYRRRHRLGRAESLPAPDAHRAKGAASLRPHQVGGPAGSHARARAHVSPNLVVVVYLCLSVSCFGLCCAGWRFLSSRTD